MTALTIRLNFHLDLPEPPIVLYKIEPVTEQAFYAGSPHAYLFIYLFIYSVCKQTQIKITATY